MLRKIRFACLGLLAVAVLWLFGTHHLVDFRLYRRDLTELDLRGREITVAHYEKLAGRMPDTAIYWEIPFQGERLSQDTDELTVTALTEEEADVLIRHLPCLGTVHAEACTDYPALLRLKQLRPGVDVRYRVNLDGKPVKASVVSLQLDNITREDLAMLPFLPDLKILSMGGGSPDALPELRDWCWDEGVTLRLRLGSETVTETASDLTVTGLTEAQVSLLTLLPDLKKLHLIDPLASAESVLALPERLPAANVTWEKTVLGVTFPWDTRQVDLTPALALGPGERMGDKTAYQFSLDFPVQGTREEIPSSLKLSDRHPWPDRSRETPQLISEVEAAMDYFPEAETLVLCGAFLDNGAMDTFRETRREDYKVVWNVRCGKVATRTDAVFFMPVKYYVYYLNNEEAANLRYCPELVTVDIGHMAVSDIGFVEYLPDLEHLILAHTQIQYIEPIRSCKKLKFLEVDWSPIRDFTPLQDCTALEDLNIGNTWAKVDPLKEMTWLKNLWMIFRGEGWTLSQALPNTRVVSGGNATVASGWRNLPNYFEMRDRLKMYYMSW